MHSNEHSLSTILNQPFDADLDLDNFLNGKMRLRLLKFVLKLSVQKRLHTHTIIWLQDMKVKCKLVYC